MSLSSFSLSSGLCHALIFSFIPHSSLPLHCFCGVVFSSHFRKLTECVRILDVIEVALNEGVVEPPGAIAPFIPYETFFIEAIDSYVCVSVCVFFVRCH